MTSPPFRVLYQLAAYYDWPVPDDLAGSVEVVDVSSPGSRPEDLAGQALVTSVRCPDMVEVARRSRVPWVHLAATGLDGVDLPALRGGGAVVTSSRGAAGVPISEWVLATMLAYEKCLPEVWVHEPPASWAKPVTGLGTLQGKRLALVGLGGIGSEVARLAKAFSMEVRALRRSDRPSAVPDVEVVGSLADVLLDADHVVLAAPLTPETEGLLGPAALAMMKPGVHVVNVARGALIDQSALRAALDAGHVSRASLDTATPEPLPPGHWLYRHPRVRLSPHVSWSWPRFVPALQEVFWDNVRRQQAGRPLVNVIGPEQGY